MRVERSRTQRRNRGGAILRVATIALLAGSFSGCSAATRLAFARQALEACEARSGTDYEVCASERAEVSRAERAAR